MTAPAKTNRACIPPRSKASALPRRKRARTAFRQRDVTRALKGVVKAGFGPIWRIQINPDGAIVIEIGKPGTQDQAVQEGNEWDAV